MYCGKCCQLGHDCSRVQQLDPTNQTLLKDACKQPPQKLPAGPTNQTQVMDASKPKRPGPGPKVHNSKIRQEWKAMEEMVWYTRAKDY